MLGQVLVGTGNSFRLKIFKIKNNNNKCDNAKSLQKQYFHLQTSDYLQFVIDRGSALKSESQSRQLKLILPFFSLAYQITGKFQGTSSEAAAEAA